MLAYPVTSNVARRTAGLRISDVNGVLGTSRAPPRPYVMETGWADEGADALVVSPPASGLAISPPPRH